VVLQQELARTVDEGAVAACECFQANQEGRVEHRNGRLLNVDRSAGIFHPCSEQQFIGKEIVLAVENRLACHVPHSRTPSGRRRLCTGLRQTGVVWKGKKFEKRQLGLDIEARNSAFDFDFASRPQSNSIASTGERGLSTLRSTHTRLSSSGGISNSSFRVPER